MLFNSAVFGVFIAALLPLYGLIRHSTSRKWLLLVSSYLFYAHWDWRYLSLLLISTFVDFHAGKHLAASSDQARRRGWLMLSLFTNLGFLAFFKYGNFLIGSLGPVWAKLGVTPFELPGNIPVGISFYTFQTMSYTIDLSRRKTEPCKSALEFALYVSFFAQLVAGPIVRSTEFLPQVRKMVDLDAGRLTHGIQRFLLGLFKKVVIADNVGLFVDSIFANPEAHSMPMLWCGAYGFALQIYCDFSAYSDMAVGIGRAFGIRLPENFDRPYLSRSITEFWRRWHLSLSSWLRDYLYIPLGGNKGGRRRTYVNLMATMLLGGLWHGASWTFVAWGGFHGLLLAAERLGNIPTSARPGKLLHPVGLFRAVVTFHLVCISWVMFRADSFTLMFDYLRGMFTSAGGFGIESLGIFWATAIFVMTAGQYFIVSHRWDRPLWEKLPAFAQGFALTVIVCLAAWYHVDDIAFIYFQF